MMKVLVRNVRIKVAARYRRAGSVLGGTATAGCDQVRTELQLDSDEPPDRVGELVRMAEASCYVMGTIRNPTPCELAVSLNGRPLEVPEGAPARD